MEENEILVLIKSDGIVFQDAKLKQKLLLEKMDILQISKKEMDVHQLASSL